ncbi:MAG: two-component system repressor protein LuxO [Paraglaciecola sp.]|jgi:two-component system repressor protein LuxO
MPGIDGNKFLQKIAEQWSGNISIMLTAYTELGDVITAINSGKYRVT